MEREKERETNRDGGGQVDLVLYAGLEARLIYMEEVQRHLRGYVFSINSITRRVVLDVEVMKNIENCESIS